MLDPHRSIYTHRCPVRSCNARVGERCNTPDGSTHTRRKRLNPTIHADELGVVVEQEHPRHTVPAGAFEMTRRRH